MQEEEEWDAIYRLVKEVCGWLRQRKINNKIEH